MLFNSDNVDTSANGGLSDSTQILFTATLGAVAPPSLNTTDGRAAAIFVAGAATGAATVAATVDGQTVSLVLSVSCPTGNCSTVGPGIALGKASPPSGARAGSVLIFNVYTSSTNLNLENTRISLTNIETSRAVSVHLFLVNGATGGVTDAFLCLTVGQTAGFLASDLDPNVTGYIIAVAVDSQGCPINFNYLIGDEYVKFQTGHAANLGAEAFAMLSNLPSCSGATSATINFDGVSYSRVSRVLAADNLPSIADGNDSIIIVNRLGGDFFCQPVDRDRPRSSPGCDPVTGRTYR